MKRAILYTIISSLFIFSLSSCDAIENNKNNDVIINKNDNLLDDENSQKVFKELKKDYNNLTYEEFLLKTKKSVAGSVIKYEYDSSYITLDFNGLYSSKQIKINNHKYYSIFVNDDWIKLSEYSYFNNEEKLIFSLNLNKDYSYNRKKEYTYDLLGNKISEKSFDYINEKSYFDEYKYDTNGKIIENIGYKNIDDQWVYYYKFEYTYNEEKILSEKKSEYINGEWVKTKEHIYINNHKYMTYIIYFNADNSFNSKKEYTYDKNGNRESEKESKYINGEWVEQQ